jgi:transposase
MVFPPNSCDLSPIENLWAILKRRLCRRVYRSREELCAAIEEEWNKLATEKGSKILLNLAHSMPRRIKECIDNKGHCTHW